MNPWPYPAGDIVPELHAALPPGDDGRGPGPDALAPELVGSSGGNGILSVEELNVQRTNWKKTDSWCNDYRSNANLPNDI
jgi:hypothetical protein